MNVDALVSIVENLDSHRRKLLELGGSFYVCIPREIVKRSSKKRGDYIELRRAIDERSGKLILIVGI